MILRRRRPLMRAAVVGGAAYHMGKNAANNQQREEEQQARLDDLESQGSKGGQTSYTSPTKSVATQIKELSSLRDEGVISEDEFEQGKQKILGE